MKVEIPTISDLRNSQVIGLGNEVLARGVSVYVRPLGMALGEDEMVKLCPDGKCQIVHIDEEFHEVVLSKVDEHNHIKRVFEDSF
ncbi:hypothetical protein LOH54_01095 [Sulfurimonas sp. HSL-3221]|uniref:hypothetical protein n=1 Tax=Sulfurimonadaceae TaxID=2771471 RepID=UPI001E40AB02|nr:hypothetical protein [Sulfurimonas sp. HSL-3221]UFS62739.1 hypothetical protein LOH54_01095 [Sulfurimonas sp. HSL-3221]